MISETFNYTPDDYLVMSDKYLANKYPTLSLDSAFMNNLHEQYKAGTQATTNQIDKFMSIVVNREITEILQDPVFLKYNCPDIKNKMVTLRGIVISVEEEPKLNYSGNRVMRVTLQSDNKLYVTFATLRSEEELIGRIITIKCKFKCFTERGTMSVVVDVILK